MTMMFLIALLAGAQVDPPTAPQPNFAATRMAGEELLRARLIDPQSAQIAYTSGFQWGWLKPVIGKRQWGWVACGTVNARNRLGGYVGRRSFAIVAWPDGKVTYNDAVQASCDTNPSPLQRELQDVAAAAAPQASVADELAKLADLRGRGVLSEGEFEAQKAKLLAR